MSINMLKLNAGKTEVLLIGSPYHLYALPSLSINICGSIIESSTSVDNLGCVFDSQLHMQGFISKKIRSALYYLRNIARIRKYLTEDTTRTLIYAFVMSRLDYCNSLLIDLPTTSLQQLQKIQNGAARVICGANRYQPTTPLLIKLHWLPIKQRIVYKTLVLVYTSLQGTAPTYLSDLIQPYAPSRELRSKFKNLLHQERWCTQFGQRAFQNSGPRLWNNLPSYIRACNSLAAFKKALKTCLFIEAFCHYM